MKIIQSSKLFKLNNCLQNCSNDKKIQIKNLQILKLLIFSKGSEFLIKKENRKMKKDRKQKPAKTERTRRTT
jgi:uncharacterized phage-associated protein